MGLMTAQTRRPEPEADPGPRLSLEARALARSWARSLRLAGCPPRSRAAEELTDVMAAAARTVLVASGYTKQQADLIVRLAVIGAQIGP